MSGMTRLDRSECAILPLVLTGRWFDMIERGEKREEYRAATEYWSKRLFRWNRMPGCPVVEFRLGYAKNAPRMAFWCFGSPTASGMMSFCYVEERRHPEWGEPETPHFANRLGGRVELSDGKQSSRETPANPLRPSRDPSAGGARVAP